MCSEMPHRMHANVSSNALKKANPSTKLMKNLTKLTIVFLFISVELFGQNPEIQKLADAGLKMTFPSIYFKPNSTDYASMPYSVDKCFEFIALNFKSNINSLVIWRDSIETEKLTSKRIKKLDSELKKYVRNRKFEFYSLNNEQKISRKTINASSDSSTINYLLSLNSVLDMSKTRLHSEKKKKIRPYLVWTGWKHGFHWSD